MLTQTELQWQRQRNNYLGYFNFRICPISPHFSDFWLISPMFRKTIEDVFGTVNGANDIVQKLLTEDMQAELNEQVVGSEDCSFSDNLFLTRKL